VLQPTNTTKLDPTTWLDSYGDILFRYAMARVHDQATAEDLVQEALLAGIISVDTFKGGSTERTWLVGILRHKILDYFRKTSREQRSDWSADDGDFDSEGSWAVTLKEWRTPEKLAEQDEFWPILGGCVDTLPENLRTLFTLRELDGLETDVLLQTLNISSKNNLWVMLSRARKLVRNCLQTHWFERD